MSNFKAKMHQIQFRLGKLTARFPDTLAGFKGPTFKGKGGIGGEGSPYFFSADLHPWM